MIRCTGVNCPMQNGTVEPKKCIAETCPWRTTPLTNADRIRAMTDEELAKLLCDFIGCMDCPYLQKPKECNGERIGWLDWLKQEVKE